MDDISVAYTTTDNKRRKNFLRTFFVISANYSVFVRKASTVVLKSAWEGDSLPRILETNHALVLGHLHTVLFAYRAQKGGHCFCCTYVDVPRACAFPISLIFIVPFFCIQMHRGASWRSVLFLCAVSTMCNTYQLAQLTTLLQIKTIGRRRARI